MSKLNEPIDVYLPRINKHFTNKRSMLNVIVRNDDYSSVQDAFFDAYPNYNIPKCSYCGCDGEWISFFDGYDNICKECKPKRTHDRHTEAAKLRGKEKKNGRNKEFERHVKKNIPYYREKLLSGEPYFDEFLDRQYNKVSYALREWTSFGVKLYETRRCILSGEEFKVNVLKTLPEDIANFVSPSKKYRMFRTYELSEVQEFVSDRQRFAKSNIEQQVAIYGKYINRYKENRFINILTDREKLKSIRRLYEGTDMYYEGRIITRCTRPGMQTLYSLSNSFSVTELESMNISDVTGDCVICGNKFEKHIVYYDNESKNIVKFKCREDYVCSSACYMTALKTMKNELWPVTDEYRKRASKLMKKKIASGEFTPNITNSRCRSRIVSKCKKYKFRSTWELAFYVIMKYKFKIELEYETIRIPYTFNGNSHTYITDFYDVDNGIVYEVKPKGNKDDKRVKSKEAAAVEWCEERDMKFLYITEDFLSIYLDDDIINIMANEFNLDLDTILSRMSNILRNANGKN